MCRDADWAGSCRALARYLTLDNQKWTIAPAGGGFYKIVNVGTGNALGASGITLAFGMTVDLSPYTGADAQLWHLDQFPDGGWRIRNKGTGLSLTPGRRRRKVALGPFVRDDQSAVDDHDAVGAFGRPT